MAETLGNRVLMRKILIVDDQELNLRVLELMACRFGFESISTQKPNEALELCVQQCGSFALYVLDVNMPVMSGLQLAQQISAKYPFSRFLFVSGTPFIFWSKQARKDLDQLRPGSSCLLPKPFDLESLRECLHCLLRGCSRLRERPKHGLNEQILVGQITCCTSG